MKMSRNWVGSPKSINKMYFGPFRWMGSRVSVYCTGGPSESGMKVVQHRSLPRGRKRRGSRGRRGGVRKRRALAGDAPPPPYSSATRLENQSNRIIARRIRTYEYFSALASLISKKHAAIGRLAKDVNKVHEDGRTNLDKIRAIRLSLRPLIRRWYALRAAVFPGEPPSLRPMALELALGHSPSGGRGMGDLAKLVRATGGVIVEAPPVPLTSAKESKEDQATHQFWCSRCLRVTNIRVCRLCGGELAPPNRPRGGKPRGNKRRGERKRLFS